MTDLREMQEIVDRAGEGVGFIAFVGIITSEVDGSGRNLIQWNYIREKFSFEDTKTAQNEFKRQVDSDRENFFNTEGDNA